MQSNFQPQKPLQTNFGLHSSNRPLSPKPICFYSLYLLKSVSIDKEEDKKIYTLATGNISAYQAFITSFSNYIRFAGTDTCLMLTNTWEGTIHVAGTGFCSDKKKPNQKNYSCVSIGIHYYTEFKIWYMMCFICLYPTYANISQKCLRI